MAGDLVRISLYLREPEACAFLICKYYIMKLTYLPFFFLFAACSPSNDSCLLVNEALPGGITLKKGITGFTDSTFRVLNGQRKCIEVKTYEIKDKIVKSRQHKRYENDSLVYTYLQKCGPCGNIVETTQLVKQDSVKYQSFLTRDKYGYETKSKVIEKNETRTTTSENEYENNHLVKAVTYTSDGTTLATKTYKFDDQGNLVEEMEKWAVLGASKQEMKYNENNQLIEAIYHNRGEKRYTQYHYKDTLCVKMTTDGPLGKDTFEFEYDENHNRIGQKDFSDTRSSDFDENGNWQTQKTMDGARVQSVTTRTFTYE